MAKSATAAPAPKVHTNSLITMVTDFLATGCTLTRTMRNTAEKVERITDIGTDAVLHSVEYMDTVTRNNLALAQKQSPL